MVIQDSISSSIKVKHQLDFNCESRMHLCKSTGKKKTDMMGAFIGIPFPLNNEGVNRLLNVFTRDKDCKNLKRP